MKQILNKVRRSWLRPAWVVLAIITAILHGISAVFSYRVLTQPGTQAALAELGVSGQWAAVYTVVLNLIPGVLTAILSLLVFLRVNRSQNGTERMAMFTAFMLLTFSLLVDPNTESLPEGLVFWQAALVTLSFLGSALFFLFIFIFPDGHFQPRWARFIPYTFLVWMVSWVIFPQFGPTEMSDRILTLVIAGWLIVAVGLQVYRYLRFSTPDQRQQTKLVAFSLVFILGFGLVEIWLGEALLGFAASGGLALALYLLTEAVSTLVWLVFPVALVMAILRYQLWEIDSLINRALVYTSLTLILTGIYFAGVVVLQNALRKLTGQESALAVVGSTLAIAAVAGPLRGRLQHFIDRRFYRGRYDSGHALEEFSRVAREEVGLEQLGSRLLGAIETTIQPEFASLWLIRGSSGYREPAQRARDEAWRMLMEQE